MLFIGDSVSYGTAPNMTIPIEDRTLPGTVLKWGLQWLHPAPAIMWGLGTNNPGLTPHHMRRYITQVVKYSDCVIVPTLFRSNVDYTIVNYYLRHREPRIHVADWNRWITKHPEHQGDGVHPDATGYVARAWIIQAAVQDCLSL